MATYNKSKGKSDSVPYLVPRYLQQIQGESCQCTDWGTPLPTTDPREKLTVYPAWVPPLPTINPRGKADSVPTWYPRSAPRTASCLPCASFRLQSVLLCSLPPISFHSMQSTLSAERRGTVPEHASNQVTPPHPQVMSMIPHLRTGSSPFHQHPAGLLCTLKMISSACVNPESPSHLCQTLFLPQITF